MNRVLCLSGIILILISPVITLARSHHLYSTPASPYHRIHSHNHDYAALLYFNLSLERLRNVEEILMRLSISLENDDLSASKLNYIKAHYQYASIRPLVLSFDEFDQQLNSIASELPLQTNDRNFIGFHAVEYFLFEQSDVPKAFVENQKLLNKVRSLIQIMSQKNLSLLEMINYLKEFSHQITKYKLTGSENLYSGADLGEITASIEGINLIMDQIHDFIPQTLIDDIDHQQIIILEVLSTYQNPHTDYYQPYSSLNLDDKFILTEAMNELDSLLTQVIKVVTPQILNDSIDRNSTITIH